MFRTVIALTLSLALAGLAYAAPAEAPRHDVTDDASYDQLIDAGVAAEILRYELSLDPSPRLAGGAALLAAFGERNPNANATQLAVYAGAVDGVLMGAFPGDPDLARGVHLLPALRFASERVNAPELVGMDTRVGDDAMSLLGLDLDAGARSLRAVDFERVKGIDFANHSPLANLVTGMMLDKTPGGASRDGLAAALISLMSANGIDLAPTDLETAYPEIESGIATLPADYAAFNAERAASFAATETAIESEFTVLRGRIDQSLTDITDVLTREPDQFEAAQNAQDPVLLAQLEQDRLDALRDRAQTRSMLALNTLLIAQSEIAAQQDFSRQAQDFSDVQLQTDSTLSDVKGGLEIGGHLLTAAGSFATGNPIGGVGSLLFAIGGVLGIVDEHTGPDIDQQIFDQIVELRQQVEDLRVEMHERFDSIDRQLDIIYQAMSNGLNQINETTMQIDGNVQQISIDLYELRSALTSLEANLYGVLSAGFEQTFIEDMETGLAYRQRTGVDLEFTGQGDNTFFAFHSRFFARATTIATDEVYAGTAAQSLINDSTAAGQLTAFPLGYNINNLRQFPTQLGLSQLGFGRVANPTTWALAADAYAQLARENPWYFAKLNENDPSRLQQVIATGESARSTMRNARDRALMEELINQYQGRVQALDQVIGLDSWLMNNGYTPGLDPWGGLGQDMTGVGPTWATVRDSAGQVWTSWFDTSMVWEIFDPKLGLAAASDVPGWEASRWRLRYRNTITEMSYPDPTHFVRFSLEDLVGPEYVDSFTYYSFIGGEPADFRAWLRSSSAATEWLIRVSTPGEQFTADGYTLEYHSRDIYGEVTPTDQQVLNQLQIVADDYWIDTTNELSQSTTLELFDSLSSSQELIAAYTALGMPETMEQNDLVRGALRGAASEQSGLGGAWLHDVFETARILGAKPPAFEDSLLTRSDLLLEQLSPSLDGADHESHSYVEWTLESLYDLEDNALNLCTDDTYAVAPGQTLSVGAGVGVLSNDAEQPGATAIAAALIFPATNGSVTLNADGSFTYTPSPGFEGADAFRYIATANLAEPGEIPNLITSDAATVVILVDSGVSTCVADVTTVNAPVGDPNHGVPDGLVTAADLNFFVNGWITQDTSVADVTTVNAPVGDPNHGVPDGMVTAADLNFFVNAWVAGCP